MVSPSLPQTGTKTAFARMYAVAIQPASEVRILKSSMIFGTASETTVWSSLPRKVPTITVRRISHFNRSLSAMSEEDYL